MLSETTKRPSVPIENAWVPVFWEPVSGTGERLMVGAVVRFGGNISAHRIIRDDVLAGLYGKCSGKPSALIEFGLNDLKTIAMHRGLEALEGENSVGLYCLRARKTEPESVEDALRTAATMFSSTANLDLVDDAADSDAPTQEEQVKHWTIGVREKVINQCPGLAASFNRAVKFYPDGEPVRFGFINDNAVLHFGVLRPVQQSSSLRDSRARLWELARAQEAVKRQNAALLLAVPRNNDPLLGERQIDAATRNLREIEREAAEVKIGLHPVCSIEEGALAVIDMAG